MRGNVKRHNLPCEVDCLGQHASRRNDGVVNDIIITSNYYSNGANQDELAVMVLAVMMLNLMVSMVVVITFVLINMA